MIPRYYEDALHPARPAEDGGVRDVFDELLCCIELLVAAGGCQVSRDAYDHRTPRIRAGEILLKLLDQSGIAFARRHVAARRDWRIETVLTAEMHVRNVDDFKLSGEVKHGGA